MSSVDARFEYFNVLTFNLIISDSVCIRCEIIWTLAISLHVCSDLASKHDMIDIQYRSLIVCKSNITSCQASKYNSASGGQYHTSIASSCSIASRGERSGRLVAGTLSRTHTTLHRILCSFRKDSELP